MYTAVCEKCGRTLETRYMAGAWCKDCVKVEDERHERNRIENEKYKRYIESRTFVYFAYAIGGDFDGLVKIGSSFNPHQRRKMLKVQTKANHIVYLGIIPGGAEGGTAMEKRLHQQYSHLNRVVNHQHEWFEAAPELLAFIYLNSISPFFLEYGWTLTHMLLEAARFIPLDLATPAPAVEAA